MPKVLNAQQTSDNYTAANTLQNVYESKGGWIVCSAQLYAQQQLSQGAQQGSETFGEEFLLPSGAHYLEPGTIGLRVRSATTGSPVLYTICLFWKYDNAMVLGGTGISSPNPGVAALNFQHNDIAVATENTADFEDAAALNPANLSLVWTVVDDPANTRVKITPVPSWANPTIFPNQVQSNGSPSFQALGANAYFGNSPAGNTFLQNKLLSSDTNPDFVIAGTGTISWGAGGASVVDTTLLRATNNPPSGAAIGLQTNNPFVVNDPNGFKVIQAVNSAAFSIYFVNTDANPTFKIFAQGAMVWGAGGASGTDIEIARVTPASGTGPSLLMIVGNGIGYGTGVGGAVTQLTSWNTGVTLSKICGQITLFTQAQGAGGLSAFTVTNTLVGVDDTVIISGSAATAANMDGVIVCVTSVNNGSFRISIYTPLAVASAARAINFSIIKASVS